MLTVGGAVTVNVALAVTLDAHDDVAVHVTVVVPPHANGAPVLLLVTVTLHPPLFVAPPNQVLYAASTAACVWQLVVVVLVGVVKLTVVDAGTVNVALHVVLNGAQLLLYVKVTVLLPPQLLGAPVLLLLNAPLHPPLALAVPSHAVNAASTCACV